MERLSQVPEVDEEGDIVKKTPEQQVWRYIGAESTLFIVIMLFGYLCVFGAILQAVEADEEINLNKQWVSLIARIKQNVSQEDYALLLTFVERDDIRGTEGFVTFDPATSDWVKGDAVAFFSSVSYCFNLVSTIGYGDIIVQTDSGKVLSIFCILLGFPIAVVAYTRFADWSFSIISAPVNRYLWRNNKMVNLVLTKFDKNHDGELDVNELSAFFTSVGAEVSHEVRGLAMNNCKFWLIVALFGGCAGSGACDQKHRRAGYVQRENLCRGLHEDCEGPCSGRPSRFAGSRDIQAAILGWPADSVCDWPYAHRRICLHD